MFRVMCYLFYRSFSSSVVNSTLATTDFEVPFVKRFSRVSFVAGQPLGYHASWPHTRYMSDYVPLATTERRVSQSGFKPFYAPLLKKG